MEMPVYLFTGFLDAGKTKFIQETLEIRGFTTESARLLFFAKREKQSMSRLNSRLKMCFSIQ